MNTTTKDKIDFDDTVFSVETDSEGTRQVHIFGYGYCTGGGEEKDCRFVEYTFCYVPLTEVLARGLGPCEDEYGPLAKQCITDCTAEEMFEIYEHYDNGKCPTPMTAFDASIPDGTYVLVKGEV